MHHSIKRFSSFLVLSLLLTTFFILPSYMSTQASPTFELPMVDVQIENSCSVDCDAIAGGEPLTGTLNGANYSIRVPDGWNNGPLLVYAHGYRDKADHAGETDNTSADATPGGTPLEEALLSMGYAVAGSSYSDNGWAVKEGITDTLALTQFFEETIGEPSQTILWGFSMGSVVTFKSIELYPDVYDGAIAACAIGAGATQSWDSTLSLSIAYDMAFGWPEAWGTPANVRDDLDFETEVAPVLLAQVSDPANFGKFEFMRLIGDLPEEQFYDGANWLFTDMFFFTEARAEMERRAGGQAVQNANHIYQLTDNEKEYLAGLGVDADGMLTELNSRATIEADPEARAYLENYANYTGNISRPVLTLHTTKDGLVSAQNETVYKEMIANAGHSDLLYQAYTESVGHCTFTGEQLITTVTAMSKWLADSSAADGRDARLLGPAPTAADFPEALGFDNSFDPGPWPIAFSDSDPTSVSLARFGGESSDTGWLSLLPMLMVLAGFLYLRRRKEGYTDGTSDESKG